MQSSDAQVVRSFANASFLSWHHEYAIRGPADSPTRFTDDTSTLLALSEGPHCWFFMRKMSSGYPTAAGLNIESIMKVLQSRHSRKVKPLEIPEDWKLDQSTDQCSAKLTVNAPLCSYLDFLETENAVCSPLVLYKPRSYFADIAYPFPNVTLHEIRDPTMAPYSVEWSIFRILSKGNMEIRAPSDEFTSEQTFASILYAVCLQIPGCEVLRAAPISFPSYSVSFGSSACPDFACRPAGKFSSASMPDGFSPITFAAHHVNFALELEYEECHSDPRHPPEVLPDRKEGLVELVKIFQPTLQLMVMYLTKKYRVSEYEWRPEWNPLLGANRPIREKPYIPDNFFVYGMNYATLGCIVYAFFPRYQVTPSGRVEWGFCCYEACIHTVAFGASSLPRRVELINTLLTIQRHTAELSRIFTEISLNI